MPFSCHLGQNSLSALTMAVARSGVWLRPYQPRLAVPSLVLAHRLYGDALRGSEIVTRNKLRHPGFVPAIELQVAKS